MVRYPETLPVCRRHARVRCGGRAGDERFDSTQTRSADWKLHPAHEPLRFADAAFQFETDHSAESIEQLARPRMAWMAFQAGIMHLTDGRVGFKELRDTKRAFVLEPDTQGKRFHAAMQQKRGMRIERSSEVIQPVLDLVEDLAASDDGT